MGCKVGFVSLNSSLALYRAVRAQTRSKQEISAAFEYVRPNSTCLGSMVQAQEPSLRQRLERGAPGREAHLDEVLASDPLRLHRVRKGASL